MRRAIPITLVLSGFLLTSPHSYACMHTEAQLKGGFEIRDDDKDNTLSLAEYYQQVHPKLVPQKVREKHFKSIDLNKDGTLSFDEYKEEKSHDKSRGCGG